MYCVLYHACACAFHLLDELEELALGSRRVSQEQDVDVPAEPCAVWQVLEIWDTQTIMTVNGAEQGFYCFPTSKRCIRALHEYVKYENIYIYFKRKVQRET